MSNRMEIHYIGACSLLGKLSESFPEHHDNHYLVKKAMEDCMAQFPGRFEMVKTSRGGYSLEPIL